MDEGIERRAHDKFEAAIYRVLRDPIPWANAVRVRQEHLADIGALHAQAEAGFKKGRPS